MAWISQTLCVGGSAPGPFPLGIAGRYLQTPSGQPFFILGDTPWMAPNQLTNAQVDTYLNARVAQGFTAILIEAPGWKFTNNTPDYNSVDGFAPFATTSFTTCTFESLVNGYWLHVDYIVNAALARGLLVLMAPAYLGFGGGVGTSADEGCNVQLNAASAANLQAYGATLAARYTQPNIMWVNGGDFNASPVSQCWNVMLGMRSVRGGDLITYHGSRTTEGFTVAGAQPGFNINSTYCSSDGTDAYSLALTAYGRGQAFIQLENGYEGSASLTEVLRSMYGAYLSGACGAMFGNIPIWGFGEPNFNGGAGPAASLASLNSTGAGYMTILKTFMTSFKWWLLVPNTGTGLVNSPGLGSGTGRIVPALASDGSFALIYSPSVSVTLNMTVFSKATVRIRIFNITTGAYTAVGSFANTGTQVVTVSTDCVVVCD